MYIDCIEYWCFNTQLSADSYHSSQKRIENETQGQAKKSEAIQQTSPQRTAEEFAEEIHDEINTIGTENNEGYTIDEEEKSLQREARRKEDEAEKEMALASSR